MLYDIDVRQIRIYHECEDRIEIFVPGIAVRYHEACRVMTNGDPEGYIFLSYPHTNNGFFFLLTTVFLFENKLQEVHEYAKIQFYLMTSLKHNNNVIGDNVLEFQHNQYMRPSRDSLGKIAWTR